MKCGVVNYEMLRLLDSEVHVIPCCDEVDETKSTSKWKEMAAKKLEKLNQDCNNTAGLEAVFKLAMGARVMLKRPGQWHNRQIIIIFTTIILR